MNAQHWPCTIEEYHASDGVSNSRITDFINDPRMYNMKHVAKTYEDPPKDCYKVGSSVHEHVLLENFDGRVILRPEFKTSKGKVSDNPKNTTEYKNWKAEHGANLIDLSLKEYEKVNRMCDAVMANPTARRVIEEAKPEYSVRWEDPATGLLCRCRFDLFHKNVNADLKTCRDNKPNAFAKSIYSFGYHRQDVFYTTGSDLIRKGERVPFWFFAVTEFSCRVYCLNSEFRAKGEEELEKALEGIKRCMDSGYWGDGTEAKPVELPMPRYVHSLEDYEVEEV